MLKAILTVIGTMIVVAFPAIIVTYIKEKLR